MQRKSELEEGIDFYWEEKDGIKYRVFTSYYLKKRGFCCNNQCKHCPYKTEENEQEQDDTRIQK